MKTIIEVAKVQWLRFIYSPIFWLLFIVLLVQIGYELTSNLESKEAAIRKVGMLPLMTRYIYTIVGSSAGVFNEFAKSLYLYIPLLTMGLFSTELSSGSIRLIYSSPVSTIQMVLGKFLPMVFLAVLMMLSLWLAVLPGFFLIQNFDIGAILSASIGIFLLASSYASIGLFLSSLSSYQIVVAIASFVVLGLFNFFGSLFQTVPYLSELIFWLSMKDRAQDFILGLFKSHNLAYFLIIQILFLGLTVLNLLFYKKGTKPFNRIMGYTLFVGGTFLLGYISSSPVFRKYHDFTAAQRMSISEPSQELMSKLSDDELSVTAYANILDGNVYSALPYQINADKRRNENYQRFKPNMTFKYIYFYDTLSNNPTIFKENEGLSIHELARKVAGSYGLDFEQVLRPLEIREIVDLSEEDNQYIRVMEHDGKSTFLRMFDGYRHFPEEPQISAAIKSLLYGKVQVGFSIGHGERSFKSALAEEDYWEEFNARHQNKLSLVNLGFNLKSVKLQNLHTNEVDILIIADPKSELDSLEINNILEYLEKGGNLFITLEDDFPNSLEPILTALGVITDRQLIEQDNPDLDTYFVQAQFNNASELIPNTWVKEYDVKYNTPITMPGAIAIEHIDSLEGEYKAEELLHASRVMNADTVLTPVLLMLNREYGEKIQRIIIAGNADFLSNREMNRRNVRNLNGRGLVPFLFHWLSNGGFPLDTAPQKGKDFGLLLAEEEGKTVGMLKLIYMGLMPCLLLLIGSVILIKRKRR